MFRYIHICSTCFLSHAVDGPVKVCAGELDTYDMRDAAAFPASLAPPRDLTCRTYY